MKKTVLGLLFFMVSSFGPSPHLWAQTDPFFKGKTIRILVGFATGGVMDLWARLIAQHMGKHIPGNPTVIVQIMPGAGSMIAANYVYNVAKPDGLTLALIFPSLYFDQLLGSKEVKFDWVKFSWIGSPERTKELFFIRSDTPYKNFEDLQKAQEPPRCGSSGAGRGASTYYVPKLLEEAFGTKFHMVLGYQGISDIDLAIQKGEVHCRAGSVLGLIGREPGRTWIKTGFVRILTQSGSSRDSRIADVPTIEELMNKYKTPENIRQLAKILLSGNDVGRPFVGTPGIPSDRVQILREGLMKTVSDPELVAEAKRRIWDVTPASGEELEGVAREVITQPPAVIEQLKRLLGS